MTDRDVDGPDSRTATPAHLTSRGAGRSSLQSIGVWLALSILLIGAIFVIGVDPGQQAPPLQVKRSSPVFVRPAKTAKDVAPAAPSASPMIRVNITPGGGSSFELEVRGPYTIRQQGSSRELSKGTSLALSKVQASPKGLKIGAAGYQGTGLEIVPRDSPSIRVNGHLYRGTMRLFKRTDGQVSAVNVLPLEEYLASVVDSEMPAAFPDAARQAQAIVSRTYALYQMEHANPAAIYDLFSSMRSQKYLGFEYTADGRRLAGESAASRKAVADTRGLVCTHRGELFCTYYSAVCGGHTTNGSEIFPDAISVLKSVPCEWCRDSEYFRWTTKMDRAGLKTVTPLSGMASISSIRQTAGPGSGVISRFKVTDGKKSATVTGVELREQVPALALRSPHFTLTLDKNQVRADGRGHGHGVGFCQWGARGQALAGKSAQEIVRYYYPGAELTVRKY